MKSFLDAVIALIIVFVLGVVFVIGYFLSLIGTFLVIIVGLFLLVKAIITGKRKHKENYINNINDE